MKARTVDFQAIKEHARFETVLAHYGIWLAGPGAERSTLCPFHLESVPSFRVNVERKVFYCFGCDAKGDILDFVAKMEAVSIKEAAALVASLCGVPQNVEHPARIQPKDRKRNRRDGSALDSRREQTAGNRPLSFTLTLDPDHPYLAHRGIARDVTDTFGLGYCSRGVMRGRICIPIHDQDGNLVAYAGRWVGDDVPEGTPRYRVPRGFKKSSVLFNLHRVAGVEHLVVVEGYWSVFRLHALEVPSVAIMGRTLSHAQEEFLRGSGARLLTLLLDGDEPGRKATTELLPRLSRHFFVRAVMLADGQAPDTIEQDALRDLVRVA